MYILHALVHPTVGFVKGSGNAMFSLTNVIQSHYLVRIPLALLLCKTVGMGFTGIAIAWLSSPLYSNFTYAYFLYSGRWKRRLNRSRAEGNAI
jgi:Na+-driven multidrug efflux pump